MTRHLFHLRLHSLTAVTACLFLLFQTAQAAVRISEVMASNGSTIADQDGDYEDWIELHNPGPVPVDLSGWGLSDDYDDPFRWAFPEGIWLGPGDYLLVWASGKDHRPADPLLPDEVAGLVSWFRGEELDGLADGEDVAAWPDASGRGNDAAQDDPALRPTYRTGVVAGRPAVDFGATQEYLELPNSAFDGLDDLADLTILAFARWDGGATAGLFGKTGASGSSGNAHLEINAGGNLRLRVADVDFSVANAVDTGSWGILGASVDGSVDPPLSVLYRNGQPLAEQEGHPGPSELANDDTVYLGASHGSRGFSGTIAEYLIYNRALEADERAGVEAYLYGRYGAGAAPHTNFSISASGEEVILTRPNGTRADELPPTPMPRDGSVGRVSGDDENWYHFADPTPGAPNDTEAFAEWLAPPEFSHTSGFHQESFALDLAGAEEVTIRYTLDGSEPDASSPVWDGSLEIGPREQSADQSELAFIQTTPPVDFDQIATDHVAQLMTEALRWFPTDRVDLATVVRVRAFRPGALPSPTATRTFWVEPREEPRHNLPVVSINTPADGLFDPHQGIYVAGADFNNSRPDRPWHSGPANYRNRGINWERPAHITFFDTDGSLRLEQDAGIRLHGGATRAMAQKSLRLYARGDYGETRFEAPLFGEGNDDSFNRLLLRNSGNDWNLTLFRDAAIQESVRHMNIDIQDYRPMVVYLNGEYWGIHNLRERYDRHYLARTHGVDPENIDHLTGRSVSAKEGDTAHYNEMWGFADSNNPADEGFLETMEEYLDPEGFIDYFIAQIFARNTDWPGNNIDLWRSRDADGPAGSGRDGRWRWLLYDTDFGWGYAQGRDAHTHNTLNHTRSNYRIFERLIDNPEFRRRFVLRFTDQLNTAFLPARLNALIDDLAGAISPEIPRHVERWHRPASVETWEENVDDMVHFVSNRHASVWGHLQSTYGLNPPHALSVGIDEPARGAVRVNSIDLDPTTPGIDAAPTADTPWTGEYFEEIPVTLNALPHDGSRFAGWRLALRSTIFSQEPTLEITLQEATGLVAVFEEAPIPDLVHYWSFNQESPAPTYTLRDGSLNIEPGASTEIEFATGQDFVGENARLDEPAGAHLRVNDPLGSTLTFSLPTTGFEEVAFSYETRRSGQGAGEQHLSFTTDGTTYQAWPEPFTVHNDAPEVAVFDFSGIPEASDNPDFAVRITFEQGDGGTAGNNRFDNVTLTGRALPGTNLPPEVETPTGPVSIVSGQTADTIDLNDVFTDPDGDALSFEVTVARPGIASATLQAGQLVLTGGSTGETDVRVEASDGENPPVWHRFRILVYPAGHRLTDGAFTFEHWSPAHAAGTFPPHMMFLQSEASDPGLTDPLDRAYHIPEDDAFASGDTDFPYGADRRTRINGLGANGISFINTGRERDLGAALVALDTTGAEEIDVTWLAGTVTPNERVYGLRLQYRFGPEEAWSDLPESADTEYVRSDTAGDEVVIGPVRLPEELENRPYLQLRWRYHHLSGTSGPRAELRLDDITITGAEPEASFEFWVERTFPDLPGGSDPSHDPHGEGFPLLLRYALDTGEGSAEAPRLQFGGGEGTSMTLRFRRDPAKTDIAYLVEASSDLDSWTEVLYDSRQNPEENTHGEFMEVVDPLPAGDGTARFLRLRIVFSE